MTSELLLEQLQKLMHRKTRGKIQKGKEETAMEKIKIKLVGMSIKPLPKKWS